MRMSFTGSGGVKTLAVRAVHLWRRLMTLLRGNPNKMEENKYQVTVWVMGEEGARECDGTEAGICQCRKCLSSPWRSRLAQESSLDLVLWS